jgi:hypothetical protein
MDCKGGNHAIAHNEIATSSPIARDAGMFSNVEFSGATQLYRGASAGTKGYASEGKK